MCAKFGCGPTVVSKKGGGTDRQTDKGKLQLYIVDNRDIMISYRYIIIIILFSVSCHCKQEAPTYLMKHFFHHAQFASSRFFTSSQYHLAISSLAFLQPFRSSSGSFHRFAAWIGVLHIDLLPCLLSCVYTSRRLSSLFPHFALCISLGCSVVVFRCFAGRLLFYSLDIS